ncbi:MAG TPA: patatin-like phospholipase family protein [Candidatus Binatia bacterium]|nr:patatin-like phospholipase family protein [Candidatus Binatia bacterium]
MAESDSTLRATIEKYFGANDETVDTILASLHHVQLSGNEWLFRQGERGDSLYFLIRGRLQVWVRAEGDSDNDATPTLLGEIVPGDSVGELSLLTGDERSAGVKAIRDSHLVSIDRAQFETLVATHPVLAMRLATRVATVLRDRTSQAVAKGRGFGTLAIVRLDGTQRTSIFASRLGRSLALHGKILDLSPGQLGRLGAPVDRLGGAESISPALRLWLLEQEHTHQFVLYHCNAAADPWSIFALRQADAIVFVADAHGDPSPNARERELADVVASSTMRRILVLLHPNSSEPITGTEAWLRPRTIHFHLHVRDDQEHEVSRLGRVLAGKALGLVLAAGAARGFAHLGVYKAMCELGIRPDWVGGTSIGAIMGACICKGWDAGETIERGRRAFSHGNPFGDYTIPMVSLLSGRRFERILAEHLPGRIEDMAVPFFAVSCNLDSGSLNIHESGLLAHALRASAAMAGVMPPALVNEQLAIDGAVVNNMPVDIMQTKPVGQIIAVDLGSCKADRVSVTSMPSAWTLLRERMFPASRRHGVPNLMTVMLKATELGTRARVRELGSRADLLLNPPVRQFGMMDVKSYDRIVDAGYWYARQALSGWLAASHRAE